MNECACAASPDQKLPNGHTQVCADKFAAHIAVIDKLLGTDPYEELK